MPLAVANDADSRRRSQRVLSGVNVITILGQIAIGGAAGRVNDDRTYGGFQSNSCVPGFGWVRLYPLSVCSMYESGRVAAHAVLKFTCRTKSAEEHISCAIIGGRECARHFRRIADRPRRQFKSQRRSLESLMVTTRCCLTPGV
jgi:hypothetical protein